MGKLILNKDLQRQRTSRPLLAISFAASLAAFACTTNYNPGNGTPTRSGPDVRTPPTAGVTSGGETTPVPPPMTSSYNRSEVLPNVRTAPRTRNGVIRRSPDEAAAIMAGRQALNGRYLGVVSPGPSASTRGYQSDNIRTFDPPALRTNPQLTVNASISSDPFPAVTTGVDLSVDPATGLTTTTGATTAAATFNGTDVSPTAASTTVTPGALAGTGTLPTTASSGVPSVTAASVGAARRGVVTSGTTATTTTTTTAPATVTGATTALGTRSGAAMSPVRIQRGTNGAVTLTNGTTTSGTTTSGTTGGRSQ